MLGHSVKQVNRGAGKFRVMKPTLKAGLSTKFSFVIPESKTVPALFPESPEFQAMPRVFATGFLVGLVEWACMLLLRDHLDGPQEQTVGTYVDLSHVAATPPGLTVTVEVTLEQIEGRALYFAVSAHDGVDEICRGSHDRFVIDVARFEAGLVAKRPTP
jgi:fluoroacetyl-CoA thioesterase